MAEGNEVNVQDLRQPAGSLYWLQDRNTRQGPILLIPVGQAGPRALRSVERALIPAVMNPAAPIFSDIVAPAAAEGLWTSDLAALANFADGECSV